MEETPYRLAYEASVPAIEDQVRVLESLPTGAGTIFVAPALVTTFMMLEVGAWLTLFWRLESG